MKPSIFVFANNYQQPYVQQYNLSVEREIAHDTSVMLAYTGVHGSHIQRTRDINLDPTQTPVTATLTSTGQTFTYNKFTAARPNSNFVRIFEFESNSSSIYNGLSLELNKRFARNFQVLTSYTWSHVIDDRPDATAVVPGTDDGKMVYDPLHIALDRASGDDDVRNRFIFSGAWQLDNYTRNFSRTTRTILGGWELSGVFMAQSGQPYTAVVQAGGRFSFDLNNDGNTRNERAPGTSRNQFRLPSLYSVDPRITKNIPITERAKVQLIAEAFNLFNHQNITQVKNTLYNTAANCTTAGSTTCTLSPNDLASGAGVNSFGLASAANVGNNSSNVGRVLQLAAKITF